MTADLKFFKNELISSSHIALLKFPRAWKFCELKENNCFTSLSNKGLYEMPGARWKTKRGTGMTFSSWGPRLRDNLIFL